MSKPLINIFFKKFHIISNEPQRTQKSQEHTLNGLSKALNVEVGVLTGEANPFAHYLRKLTDELAISGIVDVDEGNLNMASNFKFPHYDICRDELDH